MFPATVAVALITVSISQQLFANGFATLCFILVTGRQSLYYGSSFSYVAAIGGLMSSEALSGFALNDKIASPVRNCNVRSTIAADWS